MTDFNPLAGHHSVDDLAKALKKTPRTIERWMAQADGLPSVKIGAKRYIPDDAWKEWLRSRLVKPNPRRRVA